MESLGYYEVRSIISSDEEKRLTTLIIPNGLIVRELRQYICIGQVRIGPHSVVVWMVRPTVNYMDCVIEYESSMYNSVVSLVTGRGVVFTKEHLSESNIRIIISGDAVPYFVASQTASEMDVRIRCVSMGGSSLNATLINHSESKTHTIVPLFMNINIIKVLTAAND
eukprot:4998494-Ditylum_brightwellii.AAC.1